MIKPYFVWQNWLHPIWQRAPFWLRRRLIWAGSAKFLVGVAAICQNSRGEVLMLEHRFHNEHPWGFPGGWADRGERPVDTAAREVLEETGLTATELEILAVDGDGEWVEIYYTCRVPDEEPRLQISEAIGYRWVDAATCRLDMAGPQRRALQRFIESRAASRR